MKKMLTAAVCGLFVLTSVSPTFAAPQPMRELPLVQGPSITSVESPYDGALACLRDKLTPAQRKMIYAVGSFQDKTGKITYAAENSSGTFMGQGYNDSLPTSFKKVGVELVDMSPENRQIHDWIASRVPARDASILVPDVIVYGSFNGADVLPGGGYQLNAIVKAGRRANALLIGFDARATVALYSGLSSANRVLTSFAYTKQVMGYENEFGITGFFGGGSSRTYIGFDVGKQGREALQHAGRIMMDVVAYRIVRDVTGQTGCDDVFRMAEQTATIDTVAAKTDTPPDNRLLEANESGK